MARFVNRFTRPPYALSFTFSAFAPTMALGLHYHPFYLEHQTGRHPENAARLTTAVELLKRRGTWAKLTPLEAEPASREALEAVHDPRYLDLLQHPKLIEALNDPALARQVKSFEFQKALDYALKK